MSEVNEIKAGKYQLVAVRWDQITSKPGAPLDYIRHRRGDIVDLSSEDAKRLVMAGAVVKPGALERSAAEQARAIAEQAQRNYDAILAGLPDEVRSEVAPGTVAATGKAPTVEEILTDVGEDKEKAAAALASEQEARGDKARKTLVEPLQAIISKEPS